MRIQLAVGEIPSIRFLAFFDIRPVELIDLSIR